MVRSAVTGLALFIGLGCGGINGSHSISPASFFIPGLGHVKPPANTNSVDTLALAD